MCGILGCIGVFDRTQCEAVMSSLRVRGPDGVYIISNNKFYLGLSRLAIVSPEDQCLPFADSTNNIHCVVNGEIYNYRELRSKLTKLGHNFITEIDTEVVLHAYEEYGVDFVKMIEGIFALLIYDKRNNRLIAARDYLGVKPLYYKKTKHGLYFCSLAKPLARIITPQSLLSYKNLISLLYRQSIPEPDTIYEDVYTISAGSYAVVNNKYFEITKYFQFPSVFRNSAPHEKKFLFLFKKVLKKQSCLDSKMVALAQSDGVDSMLLGSLLSVYGLKRYYLPFCPDKKQYPANHYFNHEVQCLDYVPSLDHTYNLWIQFSDQPPMDGFNTFLLCHLIRSNTKIIFSGIGADELFNGYPQFNSLLDLTSKDELIEKFLKMTMIFPYTWLTKIAKTFGFNFNEIKNCIQQNISNNTTESCAGSNLVRELLIKYYLIPCLLRDADNNSMLNGMELRVPYLDKEIFQYSLLFSYNRFIVNNENKFLIKTTLNKQLKTDYKKVKEGFTLNYKRFLSDKDYIFPLAYDITGYKNWCLKNIQNWCLNHDYESCHFNSK